MFQKKQLLIAVLAITLPLVSSVSANGSSSQGNGYNTPITTEKFAFSAVLNGGSVSMKWNQFDSFSDESFRYYKVVRSTTNPKPVYPDDGYIKYESNMGFTSYTDSEPKNGINYYRICAITEKQNRYCSNVVKIEFSKPTIEIQEPKKYYVSEAKKEIKETLKSVTTKESLLTKRATIVVAQFEKKLNEKYGNDPEKRTQVINTTIANLENIKAKRSSMKEYINILIEKIRELIDDTSDIDNILSI